MTTERVGRDLRQDVFDEIISKDVAFFDQRRTGDLISRLQADTAKIENALSTQVAMLIKSGLYNVIVVVMFFIISWRMTLFTLALMIPTMFMGPAYGRVVRRLQKEISDRKAEASAVAEQAFSNIRTVKAFATEDYEAMQYQAANQGVFASARSLGLYYGAFQFCM